MSATRKIKQPSVPLKGRVMWTDPGYLLFYDKPNKNLPDCMEHLNVPVLVLPLSKEAEDYDWMVRRFTAEVMEVVCPEGYDTEEWAQMSKAVENGFAAVGLVAPKKKGRAG